MTRSATVLAQAKINLWLRVLARHADGYHGIETLFQRISLADEVTLTLAPTGARTVTCSVDLGPMEQNLAHRAAQAYCAAREWSTGFHITIQKRIPAGGGLGGGSADAAATLRLLNALSSEPLDHARMIQIGAELGADVPFLVSDATLALAWGRGERMLAAPSLPQRHVALAMPAFAISTRDAYESLDDAALDPTPGVISAHDLATWEGVARHAGNDLSGAAVVRRHPVLANATRALRDAGAIVAGMSGSGSTLFGVFEQTPDAALLERETGCNIVLTQSAMYVEAPLVSE